MLKRELHGQGASQVPVEHTTDYAHSAAADFAAILVACVIRIAGASPQALELT